MVPIWIIIGLIISTICVSSLAGLFSIVGLAALFSGAWIAVCAMAGSLELSKFVLAAYLHQQWSETNKVLRTYLTFAILVLSMITSMGIFGFLSDAYQSASHAIEAENIKLQSEKDKQAEYKAEIARLTRSVDEIPDTRITKKLKARAAAEPMIVELNKKYEESTKLSSVLDLKVLEIKKKVGPLIYISKAFNIDIDTTVKYLIFVFVLVFDPLAICLVIATTQALSSRRKQKKLIHSNEANQIKESEAIISEFKKEFEADKKSVKFETTEEPIIPSAIRNEASQVVKPNERVPAPEFPEDHLIEMSYSDENIQPASENVNNQSKPKVG